MKSLCLLESFAKSPRDHRLPLSKWQLLRVQIAVSTAIRTLIKKKKCSIEYPSVLINQIPNSYFVLHTPGKLWYQMQLHIIRKCKIYNTLEIHLHMRLRKEISSCSKSRFNIIITFWSQGSRAEINNASMKGEVKYRPTPFKGSICKSTQSIVHCFIVEINCDN